MACGKDLALWSSKKWEELWTALNAEMFLLVVVADVVEDKVEFNKKNKQILRNT